MIYGMMVGQLPFTTPYTDHGRKQRLIKQIKNGLTSKHENEMKNVKSGTFRIRNS